MIRMTLFLILFLITVIDLCIATGMLIIMDIYAKYRRLTSISSILGPALKVSYFKKKTISRADWDFFVTEQNMLAER